MGCHLTFILEPTKREKEWRVYYRHKDLNLGFVVWSKDDMRYVFRPDEDSKAGLNAIELMAVADFLNDKTTEKEK